ncbi:MAG: class I SAM-dependent methyltransferase [Parcubacteria group bacterium]
MKKIIGLDFDGVICDSTAECLITGYNAWLDWQNIKHFITQTAEVPNELADYFRLWRGCVRTADQYLTIFKSYAERKLLLDEADFESLIQQNEPDRSLYGQRFFEARERLRNQNLDYWLRLNYSYPCLAGDLKKVMESADVYIVSSGKDAKSVLVFLEHLGIDFPESKVYDKSIANDKLTALNKIAELNNERLENIVFLDDNISHIMNIKLAGVKVFMAGWGYHTDEHIQKAIINNIDVLNLENWLERVLSELNDSTVTKKTETDGFTMARRESDIDYCVNCHSSEYQSVTNKLRYNKTGTVVKCQQCGLVRMAGALTFENKSPKFYQKQYAIEYHQGAKAELDSLFDSFLPVQQERIGKMRKYLKSSDSVLEIGSSTGYFLQAVKKHVRDVCGIEYNLREAEYATRVKGIRTSSQPLNRSEFADKKFDHICLFQLLEHVADPVEFLRDLKQYLTPTGLIHVEIPNVLDPLVSLFDNVEFRDFFYQEPHLYYFDPQTLAAVAAKTGLVIESMESFQQTSLTNTLNWIYRRAPQACRWDCMQAVLPTNYLTNSTNVKIKGKIARLIQKADLEYKNILEESGLTDNIFCILKK